MPAWDDEWCAALREPSVGKALQASQKLLQGIVAEAEHDVAALRGSDGGADPVVLDKKVREAPVACPSKVGYFPVAAQQSGDLSTLRASTGFTSGRYMYEAIVLAKKKSAQIGWATQAKCTHGAGGNLNGYAFDGRTAKKWNTKPEDYGVECEVGDVITTGIDLWNGSVHFMVNGQYLGPAFTGIPTEQSVQASVREPLVFSPAISTSKGDALAVNFGSLPFRYPMPRFAPVQPGTAILRAQGEKLLAGLRMCARHSVNATTVPVKPTDNSAATAVSPADQSTASVVRSVSQDPDNAVEGSTKAFSETATSSPVSSASAALNLRTPANDAPATQPRAHNAARYAGVPRHVCRAVAMAILKTLLTAFLEKFRSIFGQTCQGCPQELLVFVTAVWIPFLMESTGNRRILQQILAMTFRLTPSTASRALWQHTLRVLCFQTLKLLQEVLEIDGKRLSDAWGYSSTFHDDLIMVCQSKPPGQTASRIFFPFVGWAGRRRKPLEFQGEHLDCEACQKSIETVTSALHAPVQRQTSAIISSVFHSLLSDAPQPTPTSTFHQAFNRTPPSGQIRVHRLLSRLSHYNKDPPHDSSGSDPCRASTNVIVNDVQVIGMTRPPSPPIRNQLNLADDPSVNNTTPLLGGPHRPDHEPANAPETEANSSSGMHCATGKGGKSGSRGCCSSSRGGGGCGSRLGAPAGAGGAGSDANSGTDDNTDNSTNTNSNNISSSSSSSSNNNDNPTPGMRQSSGNTRPGDSHHHDTNPPIRQPASVNTNNSSPSDPCLTGRATEFRTPDLPPARSSNPLLEPETETRPRGTDRRNEQQRTGGGKKGAGPPRHHEPAKSASSPADMFDSLMQLCTHATQQHVARVTANLFEKTKMTLLLESTAEKLCPLVINEVASVSRTCCWAYSVTASFDLQLPVYNGASPVALFFNLIVRIFLHHENTPASHRLPLCLFEMLFAIMNFRRRCPSEFKAFLQEYPALLPYLLRNTYGEEVGPELSGRFLSGIACVLDVPTALRDVVMRESDGKGPRSADPGRSPIVRDLASVLFSCFSNKAVWVITLSVLSRLGKKLVFGGRADGDAMLLVQWNVFSELETEADAVEASLYIATEWAAQIALQASSLPKPPNSSSVGQQKHEDQPPSPYDFVKHALTRLCWSMNELTMLAGETSPDSNQGNAIRRQKKSNMMHDLTKKLLWVLEFSTATMVTLFWPDPSAEAADAVQERKTTNLRMLFEALWHALQRFASDSSPDATNRKHQLKLLAPLVGCVVNLLFAQQQPSVLRPFPEEGDICVDESNPFLAELSVTKVEWSLDPFIYIHELDWTKAWED
eukprot:gene21459-33009_t